MVFWLSVAVVLFLDRWTKYLVVENISLGQTLPLIKDFYILPIFKIRVRPLVY